MATKGDFSSRHADDVFPDLDTYNRSSSGGSKHDVRGPGYTAQDCQVCGHFVG